MGILAFLDYEVELSSGRTSCAAARIPANTRRQLHGLKSLWENLVLVYVAAAFRRACASIYRVSA